MCQKPLLKAFQKEIQGRGVCLEFIEMFSIDTIVIDARRAALTIESSTARVILIFSWYTEVKTIIMELARRNVSGLYSVFIDRRRNIDL